MGKRFEKQRRNSTSDGAIMNALYPRHLNRKIIANLKQK